MGRQFGDGCRKVLSRPCEFDLFVFHRDLGLDQSCVEGGARGILVDIERRGKDGTAANGRAGVHKIDDIVPLGAADLFVICRLNSYGPHTEIEVEQALAAGANELLLPMVRGLQEVEAVQRLLVDRAGLGVMVETPEAVELAATLDGQGLSRMFVGLNDLGQTQGKANIFEVLAEDTVERVRTLVHRTPFGFGGLTLPGAGSPLPVEYFYCELARLECDFTFLRNSFFHDSGNRSAAAAVSEIHAHICETKRRDATRIRQDRRRTSQLLFQLLEQLE